MFPVPTKPQQCTSAASLTSNIDTETVNTMSYVAQNPDDDHNQPLAVNAEDKLPKVLCWECVARLASAYSFIQKALKTHWILLKKNNDDKITMSDIESIDRALHQLESTLGFKYYEANNTDLHIQSESDITSDDYDATNFELLSNNYAKSEHIEENEQFTIKIEHIEENEQFTINSELSDITEQHEETDLQVTKPIIIVKEYLSDEDVTIDGESNVNDMSEEEYHILNKEREVNEAIKQNQEHLSVDPLSDRSKGFFNKELRVILEDVMLSYKNQNLQDSFKANLLIEKKNSSEILTNIIDTINVDIDSTDTSKAATVVHPGSGNTGKMTSAVGSSNKQFVCDICDKSYRIKAFLMRHIQKHYNLYNCAYCIYKTCKKEYLKIHVDTKHNDIAFFKCSHCDYKTNAKINLSKHVNRKHTRLIVYNCSFCSYKSCDNSVLKRHVNSQHTKNTVYNCSYCSFKTYIYSALRRHENSQHTKTTVYNCSYCSFKTYGYDALKRHENTQHTKNTVYNCIYCSYKSYDRSILSCHVNAKHTKTTVYNCSYCSYKTYDNSALRRHVNSQHTKNTVYNCSYCRYKSYNNSNMKKHVKAKHTPP